MTEPLFLVEECDVRLGSGGRVEPLDWEERVQSMTSNQHDDDLAALRGALRELTLRDERGSTWTFDGSAWWRWDGSTWNAGRPETPLRMAPFVIELLVPQASPELEAMAVEELDDDAPTHRVPPEGLPAWEEPDASAAPIATLDPFLEVTMVELHDSGWARVVCSNGWACWVDGELLTSLS